MRKGGRVGRGVATLYMASLGSNLGALVIVEGWLRLKFVNCRGAKGLGVRKREKLLLSICLLFLFLLLLLFSFLFFFFLFRPGSGSGAGVV